MLCSKASFSGRLLDPQMPLLSNSSLDSPAHSFGLGDQDQAQGDHGSRTLDSVEKD